MNPYQSFLSPGAGDLQPFSMSSEDIAFMKAGMFPWIYVFHATKRLLILFQGAPPGMLKDKFQTGI